MPATPKSVSVKILLVTKTTAEWASVDTVIDRGLPCVEFTEDNKVLMKIGDGVNVYANLPYVGDGSGGDLTNYYTKAETDAKIDEKVEDAISEIGDIITAKGVVATPEDLPATGKPGEMYFVGPDGDGEYKEYTWVQPEGEEGKWEQIGSTDIDLSAYATIAYVDEVDNAIKVRLDALEADSHTHANKAILDATTASFTTELASKLADLENYDDTAVTARLDAIEADYLTSQDQLILNCEL